MDAAITYMLGAGIRDAESHVTLFSMFQIYSSGVIARLGAQSGELPGYRIGAVRRNGAPGGGDLPQTAISNALASRIGFDSEMTNSDSAHYYSSFIFCSVVMVNHSVGEKKVTLHLPDLQSDLRVASSDSIKKRMLAFAETTQAGSRPPDVS